MAEENAGWGAPKIHGELSKLGFAVSERTVARYHPTAEWVAQQLREGFPEASPYSYAIFDRDSKFDAGVLTFMKASGLKPKQTSVRAPWQPKPRRGVRWHRTPCGYSLGSGRNRRSATYASGTPDRRILPATRSQRSKPAQFCGSLASAARLPAGRGSTAQERGCCGGRSRRLGTRCWRGPRNIPAQAL